MTLQPVTALLYPLRQRMEGLRGRLGVRKRGTRASTLTLRTRLVLALMGVALAAVALAGMLSNAGLDSRLDRYARERLETSTGHLAGLAVDAYVSEGGWTKRSISQVRHLAAGNELRVTLKRPNGELLTPAPGWSGPRSQVTLRDREGRRLGLLEASPARGAISPDDRPLRSSLNRLHIVAALGAALVALGLAFLVARRLSTPLVAVRHGAERLRRHRLDTEIQPSGPPELRSVAEALNQLGRALAREEDFRKQTTADVAHELRTPLQGLLGRIEAAQDGALPDHERNLGSMHADVVRLARLVRDLETLADAERPDLLLAHDDVDLADVAVREAGAAADAFSQADVDLRVRARPGSVRGDADRLGQVIRNLLTNALRFTGPGGTVVLETCAEGSEAVIRVLDTGGGIEPRDLDKVFKRFWRGDASRSRDRGGAGIGLAIVERLVSAHGGSVSVQSKLGTGSVFTVRLPAAAGGPP